MKKIFYSFAVVAAMGLVACGGNKEAEATEVEEAPVEEVVEVAEETECVCDSCAEEAPAEAPAEEAPAAE